jgi:hypothetical protein
MTQSARTDLVLKLLSAIIATSAFVFGIVQYTATRREQFRREFWDQQFALYQEAAGAAAEIAMAPHVDSVKAARQKFWVLYWGKLSMVEHLEVELAMVAFGKKLSACEAGLDTTCFSRFPGKERTELRELAFQLAHCAQLSLSKTWRPVELMANRGCPLKYQEP